MMLLLTLLVKSLLVFALAGAALFALRRASASARHLICLLTLASLLALPLFSLTLPGWQVAGLSTTDRISLPQEEAPPAPNNGGAGITHAEATSVPAVAPTTHFASATYSASAPPPAPPLLGAGGTFLSLYLLGVLLAGLRPLLGLWGIARLHHTCRAVSDTHTLTLAAHCAAVLRLPRLPQLCRADAAVPMTWGWRRPVVLLPSASIDWPEDRTRAVLLHEMAHVKRRDWVCHRLGDFVCALYWFHPLVWLTARRLRAESEMACDDFVLASGTTAPDYARHLLDIAQALPPTSHPTQSAIAMAQTSRIEGRITMILDKTQSRRTLTRRFLVFAALVATVVLVPLAMLHLTARAQSVSPSAQNLNNGSVQLAGITDAAAPNGNEWSVNGNALPVPVFSNHWGPGTKITAKPGQKALFFVFHLSPALQNVPVLYEVSGATYDGITLMQQGRLPNNKIGLLTGTMQSIQMQISSGAVVYGAAFPASLTQTNVQVGAAAGPGTEIVNCPKTAGKVRFQRPSGAVIFTLIPNPHHFPAAKAAPGDAVFMVSDHFRSPSPLEADNPLQTALHDGENYERAVYALDRAGRIVTKLYGGSLTSPDESSRPGDDSSIKTQQLTQIPNALLKRVASFRLVARPYQWTEFKNVALQPVKP